MTAAHLLSPQRHRALRPFFLGRLGTAVALIATFLFLSPESAANPKPVEVKFMASARVVEDFIDEGFSVTFQDVTVDGQLIPFTDWFVTPWGNAKLVPNQSYTVSTEGACDALQIIFEQNSCFRLYFRNPNDPSGWIELSGNQINSFATSSGAGDAGGSWQIMLTTNNQPSFGSGTNQPGSVATSLSLGSLPNGNPAGKLILATETIGTVTYTPAALQAMTSSAVVEVLTAGTNIRQVYNSWDGLADVVSVTGGFEVRFYSLADVEEKGEDGFYTIKTGASAMVTWSFLNPDTTATNRLAVSEQRPGVATTFNTYAQSGSTWTLETGTGAQVRNTSSTSQSTVGGEPVEVVTDTRYSSPTDFETTTTNTYASLAAAHLAYKPQSVQYPDGRKDTFIYETGDYDDTSRTFTVGEGTFLWTTSIHGTVASPGLLDGKSTQDAVVTNAEGLSVLEELYAYTASAFALVTQTWHTYDGDNHLTASTRDGQPVYSATWDSGSKISETDETGIETTILFESDSYFDFIKNGVAAGGGYPAQPDVERSGNRGDYSTETVTAGGLSTYSETYYIDGRLSYEIRNDLQTNYAYATSPSGGLITTIFFPGGGTEIREEYPDGKLKSITGITVTAEFYTYGTDVDENEWIRIDYGTATSANFFKTTADWLGRTIREEKPAYSGLFVRQFFYNVKGQVWKETATGLADRLNEFDAMGNQIRSGLDMDGNGSLDLASTDRIAESEVTFQLAGASWFRVTARTTYRTDNSGAATHWYEKQRLNLPLNTLSELRSIDPGGNETVRTTAVNRPARLVTETVQVPGSTTPAVTITRNGLVQSTSTNSVAAPTIFTSDALGRQTGATDPRTSTQTIITYDDGVYASNRVASVTLGAQTVVHTYYTAAEASPGFLKSRSVNGNVTYFDYDSRGQSAHTWGEASYPTWTEYDAFGRLWKLHAYRNDAGWNGATWPAGAGAGDVTTWNYQDSTGLLTSKTDAANESVSYTYKPFGRVETRTWARGVSTIYSYNLAGEIEGIDYSDSTPDATFTTDRAGNRTTITDAAGTHTLTYSALGQLQTDAIGGSGILANVSVAVAYDGIFRKATLDASIGGTALLQQQTFHYDAATGRAQDAGDGTVSGVYAYLPDSDWLNTTAFKRGTTTVMTTTRGPDTLNRLLSVTNNVSGQPASGSSFAYHYDARGLRDKLTLADNSYWSYGYDDRAQVTSGQRFWSDDTGVGGMQHGYTFDAIGNRTATNTNGRPATYQPTALNQYASRTVPGAVDVLGNAAADATVTVNNQPTTRKDTYFSTALAVDNAATAVFPSVSIAGVKNNVGPAGEDAVTTVAGHVFVPKTPEEFNYDDDGNLMSDGRRTYTWDGENRLISMTSLVDAPAASRKKLIFDYDAGGRRIRKTVQKWSTATNSYEEMAQLRFIYDGWNLIAEINSAATPLRTYLWGLDISGTLEDGGGVGGLLAFADHQVSPSACYFPAFDGNGNVTSLIDSATGALSANYLYGPFGELIRVSGEYAELNPFRFSTKYQDGETGLLYYGYRYYDPSTGTWPSRDPIGEEGGVNLYGAVGNNLTNLVDFLGLNWTDPLRKGEPRAEVSCKCGDKVRDLAKKLALDPAEFMKWLEASGQSVLPSTADELITTDSKFTVPNVVLISYGNMEQGGLSTRNVMVGVVANMKKIDTDHRKLGYRIVDFLPQNEFGNDVSLIQKVIQNKNLAIWAYGGHGDNTGAQLGIGVMAGKKLGYYTAASFRPHHKLSKIIMYACFQGARSFDWFTLIAPGGQLTAVPGWLTVGRFSTGGGTPYEDLKVYPKK